MASNNIIGYSLAGIGLVIIAFSNQLAKFLSFLGAKALLYTIMAGVVLVVGGIGFVMSGSSSSGKIRHASPEVPIYQGTGKNRKIVGYQKAE